MDPGPLFFLALFGAACVLFGLWLRPRWRRSRTRRRDAMMFSTGRARQRFLWMNTFGSFAVGAVILGVVQVQLYELQVRRAHQLELARFAIACSDGILVIQNRGDAARLIDASNPDILEWQGYLGEEPDHWKVHFDDERGQVLHPGERVEIHYTTTPGVCAEQRLDLGSVLSDFGRPRTHCELQLDLRIGDILERVSCRMK